MVLTKQDVHRDGVRLLHEDAIHGSFHDIEKISYEVEAYGLVIHLMRCYDYFMFSVTRHDCGSRSERHS